jgi:hypothetical protein
MFRPRLWVIGLLILAAAALRLIDHPWNVAPIGALALFAGAYFRDKVWAFAVPIAAMCLSDLALGLIRHNMAFYTFHDLTPIVYGCYALAVFLGMGVRRSWNSIDKRAHASGSGDGAFLGRPNLLKTLPLGVATLAGAVLFYLITNFGVWAFFATYPKTWAGLMQCYTLAIPFFRTTLAGDAFFVVVLFGGYALLKSHLPQTVESGVLHSE